MKAKIRFAPLVMSGAVAALMGCATPDRQLSTVAFIGQNRQPAEAPAPAALLQPAVLDENAFRNLDLNADGVITLDEWQHFDTSDGAKENFRVLDENGDGQINMIEFLTQAPKHSEHYHFLGATVKADDKYFPPDNEVFEQPGWHLFSFHF